MPRTVAGLHYPPDPAGTHPPHLFPGYRSTIARAPAWHRSISPSASPR